MADGGENPKVKVLEDLDSPTTQPLSNPENTETCFFVVGDPKLGLQERIGGSKHKLMANSEVLRRMLEESELAEKEDVKLPDIHPDTFRHVLRFVQGKEILAHLTMEEAVEVVYVAEKYLMLKLKEALAEHIKTILTVDNVFIPLQQPACFETPALKAAINRVVQQETKVLLDKEEFLDMNTCGVLSIAKQEALAVTEIELWRAVLKWARHNATGEGAEGSLREQLREPLKHLRLFTLSLDDFCSEVIPEDVLTKEEMQSIIRTINTNSKEYLGSLCYNMEKRCFVSEFSEGGLKVAPSSYNKAYLADESFIVTKGNELFLSEAVFKCYKHEWKDVPEGLQCKQIGVIRISRVTDYSNNMSSDAPIVIAFDSDVLYDAEFVVPLVANNNNIKLLPRNKYKIRVEFTTYSVHYWWRSDDRSIEDSHLRYFGKALTGLSGFFFLMKEIRYKTVSRLD